MNNIKRVLSKPPFYIAAIYAIILGSYPLLSFKDRGDYLTFHFLLADERIQSYNDLGILFSLVNEYLWFYINSVLVDFWEPEAALNFYTYIVPFLLAFAFLKFDRKHLLFLTLLLLMPMILQNCIVQLRQGFASALFMLGYFSNDKKIGYPLILITPLIHVTFFVIVPIYIFTKWFDLRRFAVDLRTIVLVSIGVIISIGVPIFAADLGVKQVERYNLDSASGGGGGFLLWGLIFLLTLLEGGRFQKKYLFEISCVVLYLSMYFVLPIASRVLSGVVPVIIVSFLNLTGKRKIVFITMMLFFGAVQWILGLTSEGAMF